MSAMLEQLVNQPYKHGFVTPIEEDVIAKGLSEDVTLVLVGAPGVVNVPTDEYPVPAPLVAYAANE